MQKGIYVGNGLDYYEDLPWLVEKGFTAFVIGGDLESIKNKIQYATQWEVKTTIVDIAGGNWKSIVDAVDSKYYYHDEPYLYKVPESLLIEKLDYIKRERPNSKFVIGDIRAIQKWNYKPINNLYYTYTSYTDNWYLPLLGIAIPIGLGNQSPSIRRIHKKVEGRIPFIWAYGQNKLLCHPDEYHKLRKTCDKLDIDLMILYLGDGSGKYEFNAISEEQLLLNIDHFLNDTKPYTTSEWWQRLNERLRLSINELLTNWNFKEFIDHLF